MRTLVFLLALGFPLAAVAPALYRALQRRTGSILALYPALFLILLLGAEGRWSVPWAPALQLDLAFRVDGLARLMGGLVAGIGALVLVYSDRYMEGHPRTPAFFGAFTLFLTSMLGLVLSDNLLLLFLFWELTSVSSFLLIGLEREREKARKAALQALLVTGGGGLALLGGIVLIGITAGTLNLSELRVLELRSSAAYPAIVALVLFGAFTKSAQVPFHAWLPNAMEAPTPVSAFLHSATMVKAGVFLIAALTPVLGGTPLWNGLLIGVGLGTAIVGGGLAVLADELKRVLAYTTMSSLGIMVCLLGGPAPWQQGALTFLAGHALYKAAAFLAAGSTIHGTHRKYLSELRGLGGTMPVTRVATWLAAFAMAGLPPSLAFVGKEAGLAAVTPFVAVGLAIASALAAAAAVRVAWIFTGKGGPQAHESPLSMTLPALIPALLGAGSGLLSPVVDRAVITPALAATTAGDAPNLALWHGITFALVLSVLAWLLGFWLGRAPWPAAAAKRLADSRWSMQRAYEWLYAATLRTGEWTAARFHRSRIRVAVAFVLAFATLLVAVKLAAGNALEGLTIEPLRLTEVLVVLVILGGAMSAVAAVTRISAIVSLGAVGIGVSLLFLIYGAPDVAMTQFATEALTVVLFVLAFTHLPRIAWVGGKATRFRDALLATAFGTVMCIVALWATHPPIGPEIADAYAQRSFPEGHGRNLVNVILVDFRALDTLGEVTVLALAALGVLALFRLRPREGDRP